MTSPPRPSVESLLEHTGFVRGLARGALGTDDQSDDVAQEVWLAAMERGPREERAAKSWLHRVIRNRVISLHRRDATRQRHLDTLARQESHVPTPDEILMREEARQRLVQVLLTLDPIYREPLVLKYYEDLPPRKIAARLGLPVETVRTRIKRGIERIRGRLDAEYGSRRAWVLALIPLTRLPPGGTGSPTATATASGGGAGGGAGALTLIGGTVAAVVVGGLALVTVFDAPEATSSTDVGAQVDSSPRRDRVPRDAGATTGTRRADDAVAQESAPPPTPATFAITVRDYAGDPVVDAAVAVIELRRGFPGGREATAGVTDAEGRFQVPRITAPVEPNRSFLLRVTQPDSRSDLQTFEIPAWQPADTVVRLGRGFTVDGEVVGRDARAVAGATVELESEGRIRRVETDTFGRFAAVGLPRGRWNTTVTLRTMAGERRTQHWVLDSGTSGARLEVTAGKRLLVQIPAFDPVRHAHIDLRVTETDRQTGEEVRVRSQRVSADGTVWLYGLRDAAHYVLWWGSDHAGRFGHADGVTAAEGERTLHLREGQSIVVHVTRPAGVGAWPRITARARGIERFGVWLDDGRTYRIDGLPAGAFEIRAQGRDADGREVAGTVRARAGGEATLELEVR